MKPKRALEAGRAHRAGYWLLATAVSGSALAAGTVHTVTLCVVTVLLAASCLAAWWDGATFAPRQPATILMCAGIALTGYTALQCLPLPMAWLGALAPRNADVWSRALMPLHEGAPGWAPISLDPVATRIEVLKGVAYLLAFLTALRIARRREGAGLLAGMIVATGVVLAVAALVHPAFDAKKLYGVWEPRHNFSRLAPFLNPNNLASYLNVAFCLALAATLSHQPWMPRPILGVAALFLATAQVWIGSRGGVAMMVVGAPLVVGVLAAGRRRRRNHGARSKAWPSVAVGVAMGASVLMLVLGGSERASTELLDTDLSKLDVFREVLRMANAFPFFGAGRGSFESTFPAFRVSAGYVTFTHPENVVLQWVTEWGAPVGLAGLVAIAIALRPSVVLSRSSTAAGAWAAILVVAAQNLVDLGSEIPGLAVTLAVCAAIVVGGPAGRAARWRIEGWTQLGRGVGMAAVAIAMAAVVGVAPGFGVELEQDQRSLLAAYEGRAPVARMHALVRAAMLRHPSEPYLPFITALRDVELRDEPPMPWLEGTLERAAVYGPGHLLLARVLARRFPAQARFEYRTALTQAPELHPVVMAEAPQVVGGYDDATELIPDGRGAAPAISSLEEALATRLPATCVRLDERLAAISPTDTGPVLRAARHAVLDIDDDSAASWCDAEGLAACRKAALDLASSAKRAAPNRCEPYALHARARVATGDVAGGLDELRGVVDKVTDRVDCLQSLAILARRAHEDSLAEATIESVVRAGCAGTECLRNLSWAAEMTENMGNELRAHALYQRAFSLASDDDALLQGIARTAVAAGLHVEAAQTYEQLCRRHPSDRSWGSLAAREKAAAFAERVDLGK